MADTATATATEEEQRKRRARLRSLRELLPLSQEKLGALAGLPRTTINKIESGASSMAMARTRDALAAGLGLTRDEFEALLSGAMTPERVSVLVRRRAAAGSGGGKGGAR